MLFIVLLLAAGVLASGGQAAAQFTFTNITTGPGARLELQPGDRLEGPPALSGGIVAVRVDRDPLGSSAPSTPDVVVTTGGLRHTVAENSAVSLHSGRVAVVEQGAPRMPPATGFLETLVLVDTGTLAFPRTVAFEVEAEATDPTDPARDVNPRDFENIEITDVSQSSGNVAFVAGDRVTGGRDGVYLGSPATVRAIARRGDPIPGSLRVFDVFSAPAVDGDTVAFTASVLNCTFSNGIFKGRERGSLATLVLAFRSAPCGPSTEIPGRPGQSFGALGRPVVSGECVAFAGGVDAVSEGIYLFCDGAPPQVVADRETLIPDGGGARFTFINAGSVSIDGRRVAFQGSAPGLSGIYLYEGGSLVKVLDTKNDPSNQILDGQLPGGVVMGQRALEGRTIAFTAFPNSSSAAVYLAESTTAAVDPVDLAAAVLPASRSAMVGQQVGVFATIINNTAQDVTGCRIRLVTQIPATLVFAATDPATNDIIGDPNVPATIPPHGRGTFVVILTATGSFDVTELTLEYACDGVTGRGIVGVNTLSFSASDVPVADFVTMAIERTRTGVVTVPAAVETSGIAAGEVAAATAVTAGTAALAVAISNVGAASAATVRADTGSLTLPLSLSLCETNPATGACLAPPAAEVQTFIGAGATPTFGVFVQGQVVDGVQQTVPFDPARHRVFVRLRDADGVIRGQSSVAVRTEP